ncbi:hypothetical protein WS71_11905 [Burkholderia mayonis]|uniref:Uncharacterized protein n=1 Tax=Burkholderia mayonis TaxID=1385591 RepID=A0A1B4FW75_9BURK|nr:hypothetical protein WS71_11905 [Burkholderia mayonis]KVE55426.1 hypothetical protein WS71_03000 [Burkholderia mayonis]
MRAPSAVRLPTAVEAATPRMRPLSFDPIAAGVGLTWVKQAGVGRAFEVCVDGIAMAGICPSGGARR